MIDILGISKKYSKNFYGVHDINFQIEEGTMISMVGPSGCGKTTLLKILAGFINPTEGKIMLDNKDITDLPIQKRGIGMVFQDYALWPHMTVFQNIAYGLKLKNMSKNEIENKVFNMLEIVEIDKEISKKRYPNELSGGQQQRVALARALVVEPKIILMDEPLSNLDAKVRQKLRYEIRSIQKKLNLTCIYVTHDQEEAMSMSDIIIVMNSGTIEQIGKPEQVYNNPKSLFTAEFLGDSNSIEGMVKEGKLYIYDRFIKGCEQEDGRIKVILRATDAWLSKDKTESSKLKGKIVDRMFNGSFYRYAVELEDKIIFIDMNNEFKYENPYVCFNEDKLHVF